MRSLFEVAGELTFKRAILRYSSIQSGNKSSGFFFKFLKAIVRKILFNVCALWAKILALETKIRMHALGRNYLWPMLQSNYHRTTVSITLVKYFAAVVDYCCNWLETRTRGRNSRIGGNTNPALFYSFNLSSAKIWQIRWERNHVKTM